MNKTMKAFITALSAAFMILMTAAFTTGVLAEDTPTDIVGSITFTPETVSWPNDVRCSVTLKRPCKSLKVSYRIGNSGNQGAFRVEDPYGELTEYTHSISHSKLVNGTYTVYSVLVDGKEALIPGSCSFTMTGGPAFPELVQGSFRMESMNGVSGKEVLPGESFRVSFSVKDALPLTSAGLTILIRKPDRTTEKVDIRSYEDRTDGNIHVLTFTVPTSGMSPETTIYPSFFSVTNGAGLETEWDEERARMELLGKITVVSAYTSAKSEGDDSSSSPSDHPDSGKTSADDPAADSRETSSQSPADSGGSADGKDGGNESGAKPAKDSTKAKAFSPGTALSTRTDASKASGYLVKKVKSDDPLLGTEFGKLKVRQLKTSKNSITIAWDAVAGTEKYIIFGNLCGKKFRKYGEVSASSGVRKWTKKKLTAGKYYKFIVMAVDSYDRVITTSASAIITPEGSGFGNPKSLSVKQKGTISMAVPDTAAIGAKKKNPSGKKVRQFGIDFRYEWTDPSVIEVSSDGLITAKKKGSSLVHVFTQNGRYKTLTVNVE